ncbi:MAG: hypothetical protein Q8W46_10550 [Candidatus Palauibacterales bacterium]|nr:hypothetical protein [Candidatus Palauibacterales bacterium]
MRPGVPFSLVTVTGAPRTSIRSAWLAFGIAALFSVSACASSSSTASTTGPDVVGGGPTAEPLKKAPSAENTVTMPGAEANTDPRVGLGGGLLDAEQAISNLRLVSATPPPEAFVGVTNSDLAFTGHYAIQGNYNGFQVWDISNPAAPVLVKGYVCPASQSDVSVYKNLLFVSGEGLGGRLDCGTEGVEETVSAERLRGIRIFDISDIRNPKYIANVQTCRGSHTHSVLVDPADKSNVYIYVSGSASVRPEEELPGCSGAPPGEDPNSALFRIEVIRVPLAHPEQAAIVSSPRIFSGLVAPPTHGESEADRVELEKARARGAFVADVQGEQIVLPDRWANRLLAEIIEERGGSGAPTAADSAALRESLPEIMARYIGGGGEEDGGEGPRPGPTQCHDITLYPEIGLAGGACEGYGLLIDISDPVNPKRIAAVSDSNFSYWHSATFNNDGTAILFSDEWGGGGAAKCRAGDPMEWGADALFTISNGQMAFQSYYKMPAVQTPNEICVAHNGSLIPIPGRDVMVQAWYEGGVSVFDWTDPAHPVEIAFFDRGPVDPDQLDPSGGPWSVYWYNGVIVSSEIARGLDILELTPSEYLTANEIEAARSVKFDRFNVQGQQKFVWPPTFALARAYVDQLERSGGLNADGVASVRRVLKDAEHDSAAARREALRELGEWLREETPRSTDGRKMSQLAGTVQELANG